MGKALSSIIGTTCNFDSRWIGWDTVRITMDLHTKSDRGGEVCQIACKGLRQIIRKATAVALRKRGISNVWVLEGGLTAWKREGLPVTLQLSTPEEAAERVGRDNWN
jgi:hypothetical protein